MSRMSKQAQFYRDKAQEMRDLAKRSHDQALKEKLREVAAEYDRLAGKAERGGTR